MSDSVTYASDGAVATITIDDGKRNALGIEVLEAILAGFDRAQEEGAGVVLTGREGTFTAGFDLKVFATGGEALLTMLGLGAELSARILDFPRPVVIAANGHALAAGAFLLLAADVRIGAEGEYKIGLNETAIGLTLPWNVIELAQWRLDPSVRDEAVVQARVYDPAGAVTAGYYDRVVPADRLAAAAQETAAALSALPAEAYAGNKLRMRAAAAEAVRAGAARTDAEFRALLGDQ